MFLNSKNFSHQQALEHIQSLFPSLALPQFSCSLNLKTILESVTNNLPTPQCKDHKNALSSMKNIVDTQEYKIQRNMIEIQNYTEQFEMQCCSLDFYEQPSTAIDFDKKISAQTSGDSAMSDQYQDLWLNLQQKYDIQQKLEKECFSFLE